MEPASPAIAATPPAPTNAAESPPAPAKAFEGLRAWVPGTLYRYEVSSEQDVLIRQAQPGVPGPPEMQFRLQGQWNVGLVSVRDERVEARIHLQLSSFSLSIDGQDSIAPDAKRTLVMGLNTPFFVTLDRAGRVKLVHFEKDLDGLVQGLLRSIASATQFVVEGAPGAAWEAQEFDSTGQYLAAYRRLATSRFEKTKRTYSHVATAQGLAPIDQSIHVNVSSLTTIELGEDSWLLSLKGEEKLEIDTGVGMPAATTAHRVRLRLFERREDPSLLGALAARQASLITLPLASLLGQEPDPMIHYRQVLGGRRFEDILKHLRSLPAEEKARDDARTAALEQLRALFVLQPAEALKVSGALHSGLDPLAASPLLGALSAASTPEAIQALSQAIGDASLSSSVRTDAVAALGMAGTPTAEGVEALWRTTRETDPALRETAMLGLGNAAMHLRGQDSRRADNLVAELLSAYRTATTPEQQALVLQAMGNTNAPSVLPVLREGLRSSSTLVRAAAVVSLRNIPDPSADQLLSETLVSDPAPEVRRNAVFACSFRPLAPLLHALQRALQGDPAVQVRSEIVSLLGANRAAVPQADTLLTWASQNDRSPDVRQAAHAFLNPSARPLPSSP